MTIGDHHNLESNELIELSNSRMKEIAELAESSLQGSHPQANNEDEDGDRTSFPLLPVILFNAEMHIQVIYYFILPQMIRPVLF